jgi:hypothetical protein
VGGFRTRTESIEQAMGRSGCKTVPVRGEVAFNLLPTRQTRLRNAVVSDRHVGLASNRLGTSIARLPETLQHHTQRSTIKSIEG